MSAQTLTNSFDYNLRYYELDQDKFLKPMALLNILQDVATLDAEFRGFGAHYTFAKNLGWFLLKYNIQIYKNLPDMEKFSIKTESRGATKLFAYRDFYLYYNGELFGKVASLWALIDFNTKRMVKPLENLESINEYEKREGDLEFGKIPQIGAVSAQKEFHIRYDDLDVNRHVNNATYITWALEALDYEFRSTHRVKSIEMNFKKEVTYGVNILSSVEILPETLTTVHAIKNDVTDEELFIAKIEWE